MNRGEIVVSGSCQSIGYFFQMLMCKGFVNRNIVVPIAEMGGIHGFFPRSGRAGDGVHVNVIRQSVFRCQRQQCQHNGSGKTSRIGNVLRVADKRFVTLTEAENEIPVCITGLVAEITPQIDDFARRRQTVFIEKGAR